MRQGRGSPFVKPSPLFIGRIIAQPEKVFLFRIKNVSAKGTSLTVSTNTVPVTLLIGNNSGTILANAAI
jgi:hypothetical protein